MFFNLAIVLLGAFLAAFAVGVVGFAGALVASAVWLQVMSPTDAVPLILATGIATHTLSLTSMRRAVSFSRLWPFLAGGAIGVPAGTWLLSNAEPRPFHLAIGLFLIAYSLFGLALPRLRTVTYGGCWADGMVGLAGGVLGGAAGLSGVAPTMWSGLRGWPKEEQRGVYQPFILIIHGMSLGWLAASGALNDTLAKNILMSLPALILGVWLGLRLFNRVDETQFRRVVLFLLLLSGVALVI
ncbi:MAG TPA: sulfite exporter TauE/SafE family protein [Rhodospirillales bacterium]|nr:sulfite exporter TauE/SafE family protein [Rhodospirillales bacterium]